MPEWWAELSTMPGKEDTRKLAMEVRASFNLPRWLQELDSREATLQAPPTPPCLCQKRFMLPDDSIFTCRDIQEIPQEKVVVYARALQYCAEQNNLPAGGEPCLLAKSVQELREEVKWYLSFTDEEVFWGVALPEKEEEEESPRASAATTVTKAPHIPESPQKTGPQNSRDGGRYYTLPTHGGHKRYPSTYQGKG